MVAAIGYALPFLVAGLLRHALVVSVFTVGLSLVVGGMLGLGLVYGPAPLRWLVRAFSDIVRGIPILVLIFFVYYGLPLARVEPAAVQSRRWLALSVFKTAQVIENVRGAIGSVPRGQIDGGQGHRAHLPYAACRGDSSTGGPPLPAALDQRCHRRREG